jgi:2,2-dialkylglycine decarboxylase (pyruvate)
MNSSAGGSNLSTWKDRGEHLLILQPFMDSIIAKGEGSYLVDVEGRRILDLAAGQFCSILGHSHPQFIARLQAQAARLVHLGDQYVSPEVLEAVSRLAGITPEGLNKVVLLSTGSEANECAMRIAKTVTGRTGMLGYSRGYYGISLATHNLSSISDNPARFDYQPSPSNQHKLITPTCGRCPVGLEFPACELACIDASFELLGDNLHNVAGVIIEPILSAGGMIFPSREYVRKLYEVTRKAGVLFIVDEAQTGFGRCGRWFDIEYFGVQPDILVISKTAGNGYPVAGVIVSSEVARELESSFFTHLSSHQNDPLAAAAVLAVIDIVQEEKLIEHSAAMGEYFVSELLKLKERHPLVRDVRGRGLMIGVELSSEAGERSNAAFEVAMACEQRGLHLTFSYFEPVLRIIPPLILAKSEIDWALSVLDEVLTIGGRDGIDLMKLIPKNAQSGSFVAGMVKRTPGAILKRVWRTSPQQWLHKLTAMQRRS